MKCYYDSTQDAVALCRACGRGLSHDHLTEVSRGVACKNRCEEDAEVVNRMIECSASSSVATNQILRRSAPTAYGTAIFYTLSGSLFAYFGIRDEFILISCLGAVFLLFGVWLWIRAWRHSKLVATIPNDEG